MDDPYNNILQVCGDSEDSRRLLMTLFCRSVTGIVVVGDDFRIEYVDDALCNMAGRPRTELVGQDFRQFVHPDSLDAAQEHYMNRRSEASVPEAYEMLAVRPDGQTRVLLVSSAVVIGTGGGTKTVAHLLDITDEMLIVRRLHETERRYQALVESMSDGLGVVDTSGRVTYGNPALCRMTGHDPGEVQGLHVCDFFEGISMEAVNAKIRDRQQGKEDHYETSIIRRSGDCIPVSLSAAALSDSAGRYSGSIFIVRDITEQKKSQRGLERAERRERGAKENGVTCLIVMTHDIANQLQALKISAELLKTMNQGGLGSAVLESVSQSVARCESIVSNARDIERLMSLPLERADLAEALLHCVRRAEVEFDDAELEVRIGDTESAVLADEFLERLIWVVIENACMHNPSADRRIWLDLWSESGGYTVSVCDNGHGIPDGMKRTLFDPTRRPGGVGLHLAGHIVKKYGGTLTVVDRVEGSPGQGADFRIWLPAIDQEEPIHLK